VLFGQTFLAIIILLFLLGSGSIIVSLITENNHTISYEQKTTLKNKTTQNIVVTDEPQSILLDSNIGDFLEDE